MVVLQLLLEFLRPGDTLMVTRVRHSPGKLALDPSRIAAQVVSGMGFLGAGTIIIQKQIVKGLTTAAGMWVTAAIGLVIGSGLYEIGVYGAFLTLIVLEVFRQLSNRLLSHHCGLQMKLRPESVCQVFTALQSMPVRFAFRSLKDNASEDKMWTLFLVLTLRPGRSINEIAPGLLNLSLFGKPSRDTAGDKMMTYATNLNSLFSPDNALTVELTQKNEAVRVKNILVELLPCTI
ncbi:hypothetical protein IOM74_004262 [Salmonella enterica]|nr:hypothetical protein [Salmonella enterica]